MNVPFAVLLAVAPCAAIAIATIVTLPAIIQAVTPLILGWRKAGRRPKPKAAVIPIRAPAKRAKAA